MLQNIRENLQGTIAKVIIALIAIPFALFGIESFFTGGVPEVARVNGEVVTEQELTQSVEMERRRLLAQMQDNVDAAQLDEARLRGPVLDGLIERKLLRQIAERAGFSASDAMLNQIIVSDESFHDNGNFSQARFQGILASNGMSPAFYKSLLREELLITQVISGFDASEFVTEDELGNVARVTQQALDVRFLSVPVDAASSGLEVPAEKIAAYYNDNKDDFQTEESVQAEYLELTLESLFGPVAEEAIRQEYDQRLKDFKGGEERRAAHIMISSVKGEEAQAKLAALRERVLAGEDFAALARDNSEDLGSAATGGDLGFSKGDAFPAEFEAALMALKPGEVSPPVQTDAGWHLVKLLELRSEQAPSFEELRADIERDLQRRVAEPLFVERSEQLADATFNSDGLEEAAGLLKLERQISPEFGRRGAEGLFADARVIAAAFSKDVLENGQNSELIEVDAEHAVVLRVKQHEPARQQELAEVSEQIRAMLLESMVREAVQAEGQRLLSLLGQGKSIEDIAAAGGYKWQVVQQHRRGATEISPELSEAAFKTARAADGVGRGTLVSSAGDVLVFEVSNFSEGQLERLPPDQRLMLGKLIQQARGREISGHYRQLLRESADIDLL